MGLIQKTHFQRQRTMLLQWHITDRCNCRCGHCYQQHENQSIEPDWRNLENVVEQYKDLLSYQRSVAGPFRGQITVTGGEPFIRSDFFDLLELFAANKPNFSFAILTNGSYVNMATAKRLETLQPAFIQVSLEGTENTHNLIRGKDNYEKTVEGIRHLVQAGIRTYISFTAHRSNFREFTHVADLGRKLKVAKVWADRHIPLGQSAGLKEQMLTPDETRKFFTIMANARQQVARSWFTKTTVSMERGLQFLTGGGRPYHCTAGARLLTVMPNGDVYPCRRLPIKVGNLQNASLTDIYKTSQLLNDLRKHTTSTGCQNCIYDRTCGGGLKCLAYAAYGNPWFADPGCWYAGKR